MQTADAAQTATAVARARTAAAATRYVFPIAPVRHARFGHVHHDYPATDIFARCGDVYRAPAGGRIVFISYRDTYNARTDDPALRGGISIAVVGDDGVQYYGSHLRRIARGWRVGMPVAARQTLGFVGDTGNAKGLGCHVHFGISPGVCAAPGAWWIRRGVLYPWPYLEGWRGGRTPSPRATVGAWYARNGCPAQPSGGY